MKKIVLLYVTVLSLAGCGGKSNKSVEELVEAGNLDVLKERKALLTQEYDALQTDIRALDEAIGKLDTTQNLSLITTLKASDTLFRHYIELQGSVSTKKNIVINAEYGGTLQKVLVKEGDAVNAGELLAKIDDGGLSAQLAQLQVQLDLARTTFERQQRLWEQNIGSEIQYLQSKSQYEATKNSVAQLESQLAKANVTAPFTGTIDEVITDQGSNVSPGMPLMRLVNLDNMRVEIEVPENYLPYIEKGTAVRTYFPVLNREIETKVTQVSNYINPENRSFRVEVAVPNDENNIKPNLTAKVKLNDYTNEQAILVPQSVITENAEGEQYVYIAKATNGNGEATVERSVIETGRTQGDFVEVLKGINTGDQVVDEGARSLQEGQKVKILKK